MDVKQEINELFSRYLDAFKHYDMAAALSCYHLPCTLHTPDKIAYLPNEDVFKQEFIDIFTVLKHGNISKIIADKASFQYCHQNALDVCINWLFFDENNQLFTDFSAFYHLIKLNNKSQESWKIVSVVSHEIQNAVELSEPFTIK